MDVWMLETMINKTFLLNWNSNTETYTYTDANSVIILTRIIVGWHELLSDPIRIKIYF